MPRRIDRRGATLIDRRGCSDMKKIVEKHISRWNFVKLRGGKLEEIYKKDYYKDKENEIRKK